MTGLDFFFFFLMPWYEGGGSQHAMSPRPLLRAAKLCSDGAIHERALPRVICSKCSQTPSRFPTKYQVHRDSILNQPQHWKVVGKGQREGGYCQL